MLDESLVYLNLKRQPLGCFAVPQYHVEDRGLTFRQLSPGNAKKSCGCVTETEPRMSSIKQKKKKRMTKAFYMR
jgi:hypothetical protein